MCEYICSFSGVFTVSHCACVYCFLALVQNLQKINICWWRSYSNENTKKNVLLVDNRIYEFMPERAHAEIGRQLQRTAKLSVRTKLQANSVMAGRIWVISSLLNELSMNTGFPVTEDACASYNILHVKRKLCMMCWLETLGFLWWKGIKP